MGRVEDFLSFFPGLFGCGKTGPVVDLLWKDVGLDHGFVGSEARRVFVDGYLSLFSLFLEVLHHVDVDNYIACHVP